MLDKACKKCSGKGQIEQTINDTLEKTTCEDCMGTGSAIMHMFKTYNHQLRVLQDQQNQILQDIRTRRSEAFSVLKKNN